MDSKSLVIFYLFLSSWIFLGFSQHLIGESAENGGGPQPTECIRKLLPCQPYLHPPLSQPPPPTCCLPLKEMVANEAACLCSVITNPAILKSLNFTTDDALNLAKACSANADLSTCDHVSASPASPPVPIPSNSSANSSSSEKKSGGHKMYNNLERCNFIGFFVGFMLFALSA